MSKNILIVESDTALSASLREALEARGFAAQETSDGKGSVEQIRREKPDLVVLAVDLSAGQNGYLICGKLKKDDELKAVPIIIIGNPDGFAQHRKLKAHADDYVAKPVNADELVERVGGLIGFPELPAGEVVDDGLTLGGLDGLGGADSSQDPFGSLGDDNDDKTMIGFMPEPAPVPVARPAPTPVARTTTASTLPVAKPAPVAPPTPVARTTTTPVTPVAKPASAAPAMSAADAAELRNLRTRVMELQGALDDARAQASTAETRVQELESELETKSTELETAKASAGKNDSATLALREASNRKDREILRLKTELNQKEQELVELQDRTLALEQQANGDTDEVTRKDAELKTLKTKADQLMAERKRMEQQLTTAKEEARGASARATALQAEVEQYQAQGAELEELRARAEQAEADLAATRGEADELRGQLEAVQAQASQEADELRKRIGELEESVARNEDRVAKLYARIKNDEKLREKTKKALAIAAQLLEEQPAVEGDEEAVA